MKGKLIVIEGVDCSGKETQANKLLEKLNAAGTKAEKFSFPFYSSPTGEFLKMLLGKAPYENSNFPEGAPSVPPKVAALLYAADRLYNIEKINQKLAAGVNVILDRYVESNMAHQGSKFYSSFEREKLFSWLEKLEYEMLGLPRADATFFLYMPYCAAESLRKNRAEKLDSAERDKNHLLNSEKTYLQLAAKYGYTTINCADASGTSPRPIEDINAELFKKVTATLNANILQT